MKTEQRLLFFYLAFSVPASESVPENTEPPYYRRKLEIEVPYFPGDFDTQEKFYRMLDEGIYAFGESYADYGKFIIKYWVGDKVYSSQLVDNSAFKMKVSNKVKLAPQFHKEPSGNNGNTASVEATFSFNCLLKAADGDFLLVENAVIRGKYYRQRLPDSYWKDWGKGWNSK